MFSFIIKKGYFVYIRGKVSCLNYSALYVVCRYYDIGIDSHIYYVSFAVMLLRPSLSS